MTLPTRREAKEDMRRSAKPAAAVRRRRIIWTTVGVVVVIILALLAWLAFRALTVKNALESAQTTLQQAQSGGGDLGEAVAKISKDARAASDAAADPIWAAAEYVPFVGDNLKGVRLASEALDVLSNDIGTPVFAMQGDGKGELLQRALPILSSGEKKLAPLTAELAQIASSDALIGPVKGGVTQISEVTSALQPALAVLPDMLGADSPKNYLLVFQNNAEALPLGGSAASETMIHVDAGDMSITGQASSMLFDRDKRDIGIEIPEELTALYGNNYGKRVNLSTSRPDWPSAGQMVSAFWNRTMDDTRIDGAISVDPIALSRILVATGPIEVPGPEGTITLTDKNAVEVLLSKSYEWWPTGGAASDAFFAAVAGKVFDAVAGGNLNLKDLAWAVNESASHGSILAWMKDAEQQQLIEGMGKISGILPTDNAEETVVGVYFRDVSASKIDYYLATQVHGEMTCTDGVAKLTMTATMKLDISQAAADQLPSYVKSGHHGAEYFTTQVFMYAPPGMTVESTRVEGDARTIRQGYTDLGRAVSPFSSRMPPEAAITVETVFTGSGDFGPLAVRSNPLVKPTEVTVDDSCR